MNKFITGFILVAFLQGLKAQTIKSPAEIAMDSGIPTMEKLKYEESSLRRGEIVFIVSLPFTAVLSFVAMNGFYFLANPEYSFSMTSLPPEILPFSIVSALFASSMITYGDYLTMQKKKEEQEILKGNNKETRELKFGVSLEKKF